MEPPESNKIVHSATEKDAKHAVICARRWFIYLLAKLSWLVFDHDLTIQPQGSWLPLLLEDKALCKCTVFMPDSSTREGHHAIEELKNTALFDFSSSHGRVGAFVNPWDQSGNQYTAKFLKAQVPVYFSWGPVGQSRSDNIFVPPAFKPAGSEHLNAIIIHGSRHTPTPNVEKSSAWEAAPAVDWSMLQAPSAWGTTDPPPYRVSSS
jgi:hypothetical protein